MLKSFFKFLLYYVVLNICLLVIILAAFYLYENLVPVSGEFVQSIWGNPIVSFLPLPGWIVTLFNLVGVDVWSGCNLFGCELNTLGEVLFAMGIVLSIFITRFFIKRTSKKIEKIFIVLGLVLLCLAAAVGLYIGLIQAELIPRFWI